MNPNPFAPIRCRRLLCKAALSLTMLLLILGLCRLLMSCACRPTADPARLYQQTQTLTLGSAADSGIAINCDWSF